MSKLHTPSTLIIIGITGDLARRKLLPAIREIASLGVLPEDFRIIGISRRDVDIDQVLPVSGDNTYLRKVLELRKMNLDNLEDYQALGDYLTSIDARYEGNTQRLYYLSIPPLASQPVIELLGQAGLAKVPNTRLLLEKPFGTDLTSAEELVKHIHNHFSEDQVYRIDHYLAKEMAQNLVVFRANNPLFRRTWNKEFIESIDIIASQQMGIEGRSTFYEQTGALRDIVQSHLLQLAALVLMDLPAGGELHKIPGLRNKALEFLKPPTDVNKQVLRAQYRSYREEVDNPDSSVETFVTLKLFSADPTWENVPITLTAGKALDRTLTEIRIVYRQDGSDETNELVLRIQPNEGVEVCLWAKQPGYDRKLKQLPLNFSYSEHFNGLPEAYERVFVDALRGDRTLFAGSDEVLATWRILRPVQEAWVASGEDLVLYESGSAISDITASKQG
jgi:glucose-6-phosphate 1-dehydrogenase